MRIFRSFINIRPTFRLANLNMSTMRRMEDIQTLGLPDGIVPENLCKTATEIHKTNFIWVIDNYSFHKENLPKGKWLESSLFSASTNKQCKWYFKIYPNGDEKSNITKKNDFSFFLFFNHTREHTAATAKYKFSILKENKEMEFCKQSKINAFGSNCGWGFRESIPNDYELPADNKLVMYCEIEIFESETFTNTISDSHSTNSAIPEGRPSDDLRKLFSDECSDVVISVKGKDFKAHKLILSSRSPVFAAMFKQKDTIENQQSKVDITDFDEPIVEEMLNYIYTGRSENLNETADKLLVIAEKYGLGDLKLMCEETLAKNLSAQNAIDVLIIADLHHAHKLKSTAIDFIVEKFAHVMGTPAWKKVIESHPHLVIEVCGAMSSKHRN